MSDQIPTRRDTATPRSNPDDPTLLVYGGFTIAPGWTYTLPPSVMSWSTSGVHQPDLTDANILYEVITPPAHGTLLKDGSPTTFFTQQDVHDGHIAYHHDGSPGTADSYQVFARITEHPGVEKPYTPEFYMHYGSTTPATTSGGVFAGVVLAGATQMPRLDYAAGGFNAEGHTGDISFPFQTTRPNTAVYLWTYSHNTNWGAYDPPSYPAAIPASSVSYPGITFAKLGSAIYNSLVYDTIHGWYNYTTVNAELWWSPAPSVLPSATLTVQYPFTSVPHPGGTQSVHPEITFACAASYYGLADFTHPTLGIAGATQLPLATNTLPGSVSMTSTVLDRLASPVLFSVATGTYDYGGVPYNNSPPKGYAIITGGGGGGGTTGEFDADVWQRVGYTSATINISIVGEPAKTLTDSELFLASRRDFVDLSVLENRRLFISDAGTPQWVGPYGSIPFGTSPAVYLTTLGPPNNFAQNNGLSEPFNIAGTLEPAAGPGCSPYLSHPVGGPSGEPAWRLSVSDDGGRTWNTLVKPRQIGATGHYRQRLRWLKMGHFRQRSIKLECTDPVRRNIIGIYEDLTPGMG